MQCNAPGSTPSKILPRPTYPLGARAELKGDVVIGLHEIYIALARFIYRRLSFTVGDSVPAFRVKLGANDLNCVDVPLNPTLTLGNIMLINHCKQFPDNSLTFPALPEKWSPWLEVTTTSIY